MDYGEEADVLYMSFGKPREAKDSVEIEDGIIYGLADNEVIGIIITNFQKQNI